MRSANLVTEAMRTGETGQCWEEKITNNTGTLELPCNSTFRVRATGATTVTVDGVLAMTMSTGEIALFNTGDGNQDDAKPTVTVVIGAVAAYVQVSRETYRPRLQPNPYNELNVIK